MTSKYQMDLFSEKADLKIIKISELDVQLKTDRLNEFNEVVCRHANMYPGIDKWLKDKVFPGIVSGERIAYIGYKNNNPIVSSVVKKGENAKFCHLHIENDERNNRYGDLFFSMMAINIRKKAKSAFFTLPESLWFEKNPFFNSFGFQEAIKSKDQYRSFEEELQSSTSVSILWNRVMEKLPRIISSLTPSNEDIFTGLLLSIKPEFLEKIKSGEKLVEIRKRFHTKWKGCRVTLYSSSPTKAIYGHVKIREVYKGNPEYIWSRFQSDIGCSKEHFDEYVQGSSSIFALELDDFKPYMNPLYLEQLESLMSKNLPPPQSYISLEKNSDWMEAVSLTELLHGRFEVYTSII